MRHVLKYVFIRCNAFNFTSIATVSVLKRPRTPPSAPGFVDYQNPDHELLMKRLRPAPSVEEVISHLF